MRALFLAMMAALYVIGIEMFVGPLSEVNIENFLIGMGLLAVIIALWNED